MRYTGEEKKEEREQAANHFKGFFSRISGPLRHEQEADNDEEALETDHEASITETQPSEKEDESG